MAVAERSPGEAARAIASALEAAGLDHAIGGALALAVAGVPRGTKDVDVNVFVTDDEADRIVDVLVGLAMDVDRAAAIARARRDGMIVARWDGMRIDIFLSSIPFSADAARTRIRVEAADGWAGWFLSAEAIAIFKLLFFRGKDIVDLERLVAVRGADLDHAYVRRWIVDMMGEDDDRVRRWDDLVARFASPPSAAAPDR